MKRGQDDKKLPKISKSCQGFPKKAKIGNSLKRLSKSDESGQKFTEVLTKVLTS